MSKHLPGGPTAHIDTFAADNLPPRDQWPEFDFDSLPILQTYPDRMNAGVELLDHMCETGHATALCCITKKRPGPIRTFATSPTASPRCW